MSKILNIYTADFESNNSDLSIENKTTNIWLWDICDIFTYEHNSGRKMEGFLNKCYELSPAIIYFHNLKFDGIFIIDFLLKHNYVHTLDKKLESKQFSTLITESGVFYSIKVCFKKVGHHKAKIVEFRDSSKKIQGSVEEIAKSFNLPILKGEIDYKLNRDENYLYNQDELNYIKNDTEIIARVLSTFYNQKMDKMTASSDTFNLYKDNVGKKIFDILYPTLDIKIDEFIRKSYRGGVCMVNDKYKEKEISNVYCYDVNSMYPDKMAYSKLPYGEPKYYTGKYEYDNRYDLFICHIRVCMSVKDNYVPTVLIKHIFSGGRNDYIIDTCGAMVELYLTNVDYEIMLKHYDIYEIEYIDGYKFLSSTKLFRNYILPLYDKKNNSSGAEKQTYKILLNSLYGKFASNPNHIRKIPILENNCVKFINSKKEVGEPIYTAVSSFITAYSRLQLFNAIQDNYENFVYCDTDSVHIINGNAKNIEIDSKKLGAWDLEKIYKTAKYLAQKTYYGVRVDDKKDVKIAGCPKNIKNIITLKEFYFGNEFDGKLVPKKVKGGVVLVDTTFTIKERVTKTKK